MDKLAGLLVGNLSDNRQKQRIAGNVKRHPKEHIRRALSQRQIQLVLFAVFTRSYVKLKHRMTRRQPAGLNDVINFRHIPRAHDIPTRLWICLYHVNSILDLVNSSALPVWPFSPLDTINWPQISPFFSKRMIIRNLINKFLHSSAPLVAVNFWYFLTSFF